MSSFEDHEMAFNLTLYKKFRFYYILDPKSAKIYNYNIYRLVHVAIIIFVIGVNVYGLLGFVVKMEDTVDEIKFIQIIYCHMHILLYLIKMSVCVYNADKIWDLLNVARTNFLKSPQSSKHINVLHRYQRASIKITDILYVLLQITCAAWLSFPLLFNARRLMKTSSDGTRRYENILNFRFPVTINAYNNYYFVFYVIESILVFVIAYSILLIDTLLISIVYILIAHYETLSRAFTYIGHEQKHGKDMEKNYRNKY